MGYGGFGLQKWIYSRKPRTKMYVRELLPSFTALPKYSRTFQLKPSVKENNIISGLITICLAAFMIFSFSLFKQKFVSYSKEHNENIITQIKHKNEVAFNFLIKSGTYKLQRNDIVGAYSEFKFAYNIDKHNTYLNQLLTETLSILCEEGNQYCNELDDYLFKMIKPPTPS